MHFASKITGFICAILTIILWAITLTTDLAAGSVITAVCLTAIVGVAGLLSLHS
jgi:hypothetical protein